MGCDRRIDSVVSENSEDFLSVTIRWSLIFLQVAILAFLDMASCGHAGQNASYETRVKYRAREKIDFPDFTVEYLGERRKTLPVYPRGFLYYDFKITRGKTEKVVSWTTGTGIIDPTDFEFDGKRYHLELRRSEKLGKLNDNELVIGQGNFRSR